MVRYSVGDIRLKSHRFVTGKTYSWAYGADVAFAIEVIKYYAGWADKLHGKTIEACPIDCPNILWLTSS